MPQVRALVSGLLVSTDQHAFACGDVNGLRYGAYLNRKPNGRYLLVSLNNVVNRKVQTMPAINPLDWCDDERCHVLSICDPTLFLNDRIQIGAFLGTRELDPMPAVIALAAETARRLGVSSDRVIYWGLSGGGFATMQAACLTGGTAVAINAQADLRTVADWNVFQWMAEAFGAQTVEVMCDESHQRTSVPASLALALAEGRGPIIFWGQNTLDVRHHDHHFLPVIEGVGRGCVVGLPYTSAEGHAPAPPEINRWLLSEALAHLSQDQAKAA